MIRHASAVSLLISCFLLQPLRGANPDDIKFELRLVGDSHVFHQGEAIPLEFAYSSETEKKYYGSFMNPSPELGVPKVEVTPATGIINLRSFHDLIAGSWLSSDGFLTAEPRTERMDLSNWYQFRNGGHYSVRVISSSFTRVKTADEPGERLTLESNAVEFDVLPTDAAWAAEEQTKFDQVLRTQPVDSQAWRDALKRLARLGTPESDERLVELYLSNEGKQRPWEIDYEIRESLHPEIVIQALLSALSNPALDPPASISQLLADLETRNKLGAPPTYPGEQTPEWKAKLDERQKTHQEYLQQANDLLLASAQKRSGENRAAAIFQVWWNAEGFKQTAGISPEALERLRNAVLSVRDELPLNLQWQLASAGWQSFPHAQLLPLVRKFAKESLDSSFAAAGYQYLGEWCQEEEEPCNQAILEAVKQPGAKAYKPAVLLLTESEHPELDGWLREELHSPEMGQMSADAVTMAALVLRAGSENLLPDVLQRLDKTFPNAGYDCELRADLLGYVFRFNPKQGAKRLSATLQSPNDRCAGQLLRALNTDRYSDDLIPPAIAALQSANVAAVGSAALFLAEHGPGGTEETIMKRLDAFHDIWRDRAELENLQVFPLNAPQREASQVEQELASALVRGRHWQLSASQVDHVHSTCLTEQCRSIAEGKMSLGF